jgi:integrase
MRKRHPENIAVKRNYLRWLANAQGKNEATVDQVASAIDRFERHTGWADFKTFNGNQAIAFKAALAKETTAAGKPLAKATVCSILRSLKGFFEWLSREPRYKRAVAFSDAAYFNPNSNDARAAGAVRRRPYPSLEQAHAALSAMPAETVVERRDRAVLALILLTGGRDGAIASLRLKHLDTDARTVFFDARDVKTKRAKTFRTRFFPVGGGAEAIVQAWERELRETLLFGPDDPIFPATRVGLDDRGSFTATGFERRGWSNAQPIRAIFKSAFGNVGLPAYNPHSFRNMLVALSYRLRLDPKSLKAWSQNLGHDHIGTTLSSYGKLDEDEQIDVIARLGVSQTAVGDLFTAEQVTLLINRLKASEAF